MAFEKPASDNQEESVDSYFEGDTWELPSDPKLSTEAMEHLEKRLIEAGIEESRASMMAMGFQEQVTNAIVHGNLEVGDIPDGESPGTMAQKQFEAGVGNNRVVTISLNSLKPDNIQLVIQDQGPGFDVSAMKEKDITGADILENSGRGGLISKTAFDMDVTSGDNGTTVRLSAPKKENES